MKSGKQLYDEFVEAQFVEPTATEAELSRLHNEQRTSSGESPYPSDDQGHGGFGEPPCPATSPGPQDVRERFEAWERKRCVTALDRNPKGTWGDEAGEKYAASHVQSSWEAWQAALAQSDAQPPQDELWKAFDAGVAFQCLTTPSAVFGRKKRKSLSPEEAREALECLWAYQEHLSEETCYNLCDKTHEAQGCASGTCALASSRIKVERAIAALVTPTPPSSAGLIEAERERLAQMIEQYALEREPGTERVVLYFAANDIRRGRRLTDAERIENLAKAMEPEYQETADYIRARAADRSAREL